MSGTSQFVAVSSTAAVLLVSASTTIELPIPPNRFGEIRNVVETGLCLEPDASPLAVDGASQTVESRWTLDESNPVRRISFNNIDLTEEEISLVEQLEGIPDAVTEFEGKFVMIEGFMYSPLQDTELPAFVLVERRFL